MNEAEMLPLLIYAKNYLKILSPQFIYAWSILKYSQERYWSGAYYHESKMMYFNGYPARDTIFHESVHFKQAEDGRLKGPRHYQRYYKGIVWLAAYRKDPFEVEARELATQMATKLRNKIDQDRMALPGWNKYRL